MSRHRNSMSAKQAGEVAVEAGKRQPGIEYVVGGDRRPELTDRLVPNVVDHRRGLGFSGDRDRDHPDVLAMHAGHLDERLIVVMGHHLELAIGQALPAFGALKPASLSAKNVEHVHAISLPPITGRQTTQSGLCARQLEANLIVPGRGKALTAEPQLLSQRSFAVLMARDDTRDR